MSDLLRVVTTESTDPLSFVCYHSVAVKHLKEGYTDGSEQPTCRAVPYEYDSVLQEICVTLGWQGGTRQQVLDEIKKLKTQAKMPDLKTVEAHVTTTLKLSDDFLVAKNTLINCVYNYIARHVTHGSSLVEEKFTSADNELVADIREIIGSWLKCNDDLTHRECAILNSIVKCYKDKPPA